MNLYNCCDSVVKSADLFALRHQSAEYLTLATGPEFFGICLRPNAVSEEHRVLFSRHDDLVKHSANTIQFLAESMVKHEGTKRTSSTGVFF